MTEIKKAAIKKMVLTVLAHTAIWLVFLCLPALFNPRRQGLGPQAFLNDLLLPARRSNGLLLIAAFYFNYLVAIPRFYFGRKYWWLALSFVTTLGLLLTINHYVKPTLPPRMGPGRIPILGYSFNLFMLMVVHAVAFALCFYQQWQRVREEKLHAEIAFLKAQINPHFLFNTLNSIYSLALTRSERTADAVIRLSGLMRYAISDADRPMVGLDKEIAYVNNYIDLQLLRLTDRIDIQYEIKGEPAGFEIAPFLLIPFVENAFKYGVNSEDNSRIAILLDVQNGVLRLHVTNNKVYLKPNMEHQTGLGIQTTRRRLDLLYPGKYTLDIKDGEKEFDVALKIVLA
jgi:hypothetical protein